MQGREMQGSLFVPIVIFKSFFFISLSKNLTSFDTWQNSLINLHPGPITMHWKSQFICHCFSPWLCPVYGCSFCHLNVSVLWLMCQLESLIYQLRWIGNFIYPLWFTEIEIWKDNLHKGRQNYKENCELIWKIIK